MEVFSYLLSFSTGFRSNRTVQYIIFCGYMSNVATNLCKFSCFRFLKFVRSDFASASGDLKKGSAKFL